VSTQTERELRARLAHALTRPDEHGDPEGSLYLHALACVYLAAPEPAEPALGHEFHLAAEAEQVDGDEVLTALCLVEVTP
jgi:hypothetical protein